MTSIRMQIKYPEPPIGQLFLLRGYLERLFTDARFEGEAWRSCVAAFLATPGVPLLAQNATTQAPASFFYELFQPRGSTDPAFQRPEWITLLDQLKSLGGRRVAQLIITDASFSWVLFLSDDLTEVLAFGGRPLPGRSRFDAADEDRDLRSAKFLREVFGSAGQLRLTKFSRDRADVTVILEDQAGKTTTIAFEHALSVRFPTRENESVGRLIEVSGASGRTWFVFEPAEPSDQRVLAIQASSAQVQAAPA